MTATQVQLRRGTTVEHAAFTGAAGEVTIDTTKKVPVVHDGSTAGGFPAASAATIAADILTSAAALRLRGRVRAATTANITIATALNNADTLDGVSLATGDLVLVKDQSAPAENGIYVVGTSPARSGEFTAWDDHPGSLIAVAEGTVNADTLWLCTANKGGTLGSTSVTWVQAPAALASTTEVLTGTDAKKAVTADALAALWEQGSDVASAATISFGEGLYFYLTGSTGPVTDIDFATDKAGRAAWVRVVDGGSVLAHGASLVCPNGANITTVAGDTFLVISQGSDVVRILAYHRYSGQTLHGAASTTEALTGTDANKIITADALAALWEKGSNVASASIVSLGEGGYFHITGTTTITDIDFATAKDGRWAWVVFDGILTLTHNGTTLILPGGASITTAAGDRALFVQDASDNVYCAAYIRASGKAVIAPAFSEVTSPPTTLSGYGITDAPTKVGSTTDNAIVRFDGTTGQQQNSGVTIDDSNNLLGALGIRSRTLTIADDAATSFPIPSLNGATVMIAHVGIGTADSGVVAMRGISAVAAAIIAAGASIAVSTGVLAGTTGVDGKVTLSPHTDGNCYEENRSGGSLTCGLTLFLR